MAYIGFRDLFKEATTNVLDDFYYTEGGGTTPTDYPMANAQTRRLGSVYRRTTGGFVDLTFHSKNALVAGDEHLVPNLVGVLGHNLTVGDQLSITVTYRVNPGTTVLKTIPISAANTDKFNNTFFPIRERLSDIPWKVQIRFVRAAPISAYIDVGRIWMGPLWDVGNPTLTTQENLIQERWKLSMSSGAKSDISIGNQSYTNGAKSFKNLDFKMIFTNDGDFIGDGTKGLNQTNSGLAFINELENGGECIVVPREFDATQSPSARDSLWATRVGIYGESGKSAHSINQISALQYELALKIKELQ